MSEKPYPKHLKPLPFMPRLEVKSRPTWRRGRWGRLLLLAASASLVTWGLVAYSFQQRHEMVLLSVASFALGACAGKISSSSIGKF